jgi:hypothetical protein
MGDPFDHRNRNSEFQASALHGHEFVSIVKDTGMIHFRNASFDSHRHRR